ncbi:MAG TPA: toxic anion resistance protein [Candidatus Dormibacteraeota bacterium]
MTDTNSSGTTAQPVQALTLEPPPAVPAVTQDQAANSMQIDPATASQIDQAVQSFVDGVAALDPKSPDFQKKVDSVSQLGNQEIRQSAEVSNRFLERPVAAMESGAVSGTSGVSKSLVQLRRQVEDLDPGRQGLGAPGKLLGILPVGNSLRDYFHKYQSAQHNLDAIIQSLYSGQEELQRDDAAIDQEKVNVWALKSRLEQYAYMAGRLDDILTDKADQLDASDPDKAKALRGDILFYVRQKRQDLLTQLAVNMQGYLALDLVRKNNVELIKGVDRATTTTVSALRTAIIVAQALTNERLVLNQITALNTTTGNLIESTSQMLREQTGEIQSQAASSTVNLQQLQTAFQNIYATMDSIDAFKLQALDNMKQTIDALNTEISKAQDYVKRAQDSSAGQQQASALAPELALPGGGSGGTPPSGFPT